MFYSLSHIKLILSQYYYLLNCGLNPTLVFTITLSKIIKIAGRINSTTNILTIAPLAIKEHKALIISIFEYNPTPKVAAKKPAAKKTAAKKDSAEEAKAPAKKAPAKKPAAKKADGEAAEKKPAAKKTAAKKPAADSEK